MKLFHKIFLVGIVGLAIALIITLVAAYCSMGLVAIQGDMQKYLTFRSEVMQAEAAHLNWLRNIDDALICDKPELTIVVDGTLCAFGIWYYSDDAKAIVAVMTKDIQDLFHALAPDHLEVHQLGGQLVDAWKKDDLAIRKEFSREKIVPKAQSLLAQLKEILKLADVQVTELHKKEDAFARFQNLMIWGTLIFGAVVLVMYSWMTARSITVPLKSCGAILDEIAEQGNIETDVPPGLLRRRDEIGVLGRDIGLIVKEYRSIIDTLKHLSEGNWTQDVTLKGEKDLLNINLKRMIDEVNNALLNVSSVVGEVATGSREVSSASDSLSQGATTSAASLEEITASMGEVGSQTNTNASNATEANRLAKAATDAAVEGKEMMQRMIASMEQITKNAADVQRVIKVIDDISFQTNLLALNAAVEAARAGVHGKGFAVVAEEVRNLAARCAKAAGETSQMIENNNKQIHEGAAIATETSGKLDVIVEQSEKTAGLISDIAIASNEQAQGIQQISQGLHQIDSVTQQNTAAAEETASVSREMSSSASTLQNLVGQFKLRQTKRNTVTSAAQKLQTPPSDVPVTAAKPPVAAAKPPVTVAKPPVAAVKPPATAVKIDLGTKPTPLKSAMPTKPTVSKAAAISKPRIEQNPSQFPDEPAHDVKDGWGGVPHDQEILINLDDKNFGKY